MQLSHYLKIFESRDNPDECIAFSTKRASIVQLARETLTEIASGDLCREDAELLARLEIIVPDVETEKKAMLAFGRTWGRSSPVLNIVAILNLDCNFACPYCYENGVKGNFYMSGQTADALIAFAKQRFDADKKMLLVDFHGGEPLLSLDLIRHISGALKPFVESEGGTYSFTLVTNGSLLNRKTVEALKTLGLESVKITLDGPAELHNSSRPYKSGAGTFDVIVNHIKETCDLVKVNIGGNFEQENFRRFPGLLDVLIDEGLTPDRVGRIKFDPVTASIDRSEALAAYKGGCSCLNEPWLVEAEAFLREAIFARGYRAVKPQPAFCMVESENSFTVNWDGGIYKCPAFAGREGFQVGDLESGVGNVSDSYHVQHWAKNQACMDCVYLPMCFGGCRFLKFVRDGRIDEVDCKKPYLDAALEGLVLQEVRYRDGR